MEPTLTDTLCTRCGLCCDGSLFADVELGGIVESTRLEVLGLEIDDDDTNGELLLLPCGALKGRLCGIYAHRPRCCRTFECGLLQNVRQGAVSVERASEQIADALKRIARVKWLMTRLGQRDARLPLRERVASTLAAERREDPRLKRMHAELEAAMAGVEALIRKTFLGGEAPERARRARGPRR